MTRYEASQKQRQLETAIRYAKDERGACAAAGDRIGATQTRRRSAALGREYKSFCEKAGLTPRTERVRSMTGSTLEKAPKSLEKTAKSGIMKTGAVSGALDPDSSRAQEHAERYYEAVRKMSTDVERIARNTGYSESEIQRIKNFIFMDVHDLGEEGIKRFAASYEMAESWQRLMDGKNIQSHDFTLLKHEIMERNLMEHGYSQDEAHRIVSQIYNYAKEAYKYYHG